MKLRNIFLASLAVCTMASCSKDETIDYSQMGPVDAYVSLAATSAIQTKATVDTEGNELLTGEKYINSLTAYVFKQTDGALAGVKHLTVEEANKTDNGKMLVGDFGLKAINHIVVKVTPNAEGTSSTDQFTAVIVANCEQLNVSSLTDLKSKTIATALTTPADVKDGKAYLPMASDEINFGGLVPNIVVNGVTSTYTENWLNGASIYGQESSADPEGIPEQVTSSISLKRLVARVQVEKLIFNLEDQYPGASFKLTNLALVNVRPTSTVEIGNGQYVKGYKSAAYAVSQKWISPSSTFASALGKTYTYEAVTGNNQEVNFNDASHSDDKFCVYAYSNEVVPAEQIAAEAPYTNDNNIYQTALLIAGKFKRSQEVTGDGEVRHFRVLLKDGTNPVKVLANHVYKLTVTITGEGSPNEDEIRLNTHVAATIEVAPWNVIEQTEEDAN